MTTFLEFTAIIIGSTAAMGAMLYFGRRHIHRQMEEIAEAAAFKRPIRFRALRTLSGNQPPRASLATPSVAGACSLRRPLSQPAIHNLKSK